MSNYEISLYLGALITTVFLIVGYILTHSRIGEKK